MGQVPKKITYLIVGSGRLARHFQRYLSSLGMPVLKWSRNNSPHFNSMSEIEDSEERLRALARRSSHILFAVSDNAITSFFEEHQSLFDEHTLVHFSGTLYNPQIIGAHPLMTFTEDLYELQTYKNIPFVLDADAISFAEILPGVANPHFMINPQHKAHYHALCAMAGNFPVILWQAITKDLQKNFNLPAEIFYPFLEQVLIQFMINPSGSLTGPLARGDQETVRNHLDALDQNNLKSIYQSFVDFYQSQSLPPPNPENLL